MEGWVKLHRKLIDWEWYQDSKMVHLFLHLLFSANFEDKKWMGVLIKRGQLATGLNALHLKTGISIQSLRTCLKHLEKTGEINKQTNNQFSIITISNYDSYQLTSDDTNKQPNKRTTSNQQATNKQLTTTKNVKKDKNEKEVNKIPMFNEFKKYALEKKQNIDIPTLKLKYESWVENGWKDGNENKITNWKSKLLNTLPYLKETIAATGRNIKSEIAPNDFGISSPTAVQLDSERKKRMFKSIDKIGKS